MQKSPSLMTAKTIWGQVHWDSNPGITGSNPGIAMNYCAYHSPVYVTMTYKRLISKIIHSSIALLSPDVNG